MPVHPAEGGQLDVFDGFPGLGAGCRRRVTTTSTTYRPKSSKPRFTLQNGLTSPWSKFNVTKLYIRDTPHPLRAVHLLCVNSQTAVRLRRIGFAANRRHHRRQMTMTCDGRARTGLVERIPHTGRHIVTDTGLHHALPFNSRPRQPIGATRCR